MKKLAILLGFLFIVFMCFEVHAILPDVGPGSLRPQETRNLFHIQSQNGIYDDEPEISSCDFPNITSAQSPEIGDTFVQTEYNPDAQTITQNYWEYKPGFAMYDLSDNIVIDLADRVSNEGWILKEQRMIREVREVVVIDGEIESFIKHGENLNLSDFNDWDNKCLFDYKYKKDSEGNWELTLNIKDEDGNVVNGPFSLEQQQELEIGDIQDVDSLINMVIYEPDKDKRSEIITRIEELGTNNDLTLAKNLSDLLYDDNVRVRIAAPSTLGMIMRDLRAIDALIIAFGDEESSVRQQASQVFMFLVDTRAVGPLIEALGDENPHVRLHAASALSRMADPAFRRGEESVIEALKNAVEPLIELLNDSDFVGRNAAANALGNIRDPRAVDALIEALQGSARNNAARALGRIRDPRAVRPLIELLGDDSNAVRDALRMIGAPAVEALIEALGAEDPNVRSNAESTLRNMNNSVVLEPLIKALGNDNLKMREGAAELLVRIGEPAVELLIEALEDSNPAIQTMAAQVLVIQGPQAMKIALESLGCEVPETLISEGSYENVVKELINILGSEDTAIKESAVFILTHIGASAIESLIEVVEDPALGHGAKETLINIGNASFVPVIEILLSSSDVEQQHLAREIIQGISDDKTEQETGIDPTVDIIDMVSMSKEELIEIISYSEYSITRAIALYYLGNKFESELILRNYVFNNTPQGLAVQNNDITKLEIAAILNTGIPAEARWWDKLANRDERVNYLELVLKGDFTDERHYIGENRTWLCTQFTTQFVMNCGGYDKDNFADEQAFKAYGVGYVIPRVDYGIPVYYTTSYYATLAGTVLGHAFNAVFVGDDMNNVRQINDINNWIFIEPIDDDFSPNLLGSTVTIFLNLLFLPDGQYRGEYSDVDTQDTIEIRTTGYPYGADNW